MITMRQIEDVSGRIAAEFEPERILLIRSILEKGKVLYEAHYG